MTTSADAQGTRPVILVILLLFGVVLVSLSAIREGAVQIEMALLEVTSITAGNTPTVIANSDGNLDGLRPTHAGSPGNVNAARPSDGVMVHRSMVVMSDNRQLQDNFADIRAANGYHSLAVAINFLYAKKWSYDFKFFQIVLNESSASALGANVASLPRNKDHKHSGACFHVQQREVRSAPWCKLLPSWLASREQRDGWAVYLDSDIIFLDDSRSLEYVLDDPAHHKLTWGALLSNTTIGFIANLPWMSLFPVTCFFWFRPGERASRFMQYWWDVKDTSHAFEHGFEQESVWMWQGEFESEMSVIDGVTIQDSPGQWMRHHASNRPNDRVEPLITRLAALGVNEIEFKSIIHDLRETHYEALDAVAVASAMESARPADMKVPSYTFPDGGNRKDACALIDCYKPRTKGMI